MARKFAAVVFSLGCLHASSSLALGLGDLTMDSFLNEPLKARVDLLNTGGLHEDQIRVRLATREDFERMGVERAYFLTSIKFEVSLDGQGRTSILLTSEDPVLEPYLDFIVEARWPSGRLLREYTVLVDPPLFDETTPVISATERVVEVEGLSVPAEAEKKTDEAAATSGTRVDIRKSDLGPGEMPQRDYNAGTSSSPISGARYMISRDDTLWEIALAAKPSGVSVHQTMLDIQRMNPDAFIDGNINRIKAGYIVYLPTEDDISSTDLASALAEVRQQNKDWEAGRASKPLASGGPSLRISADPAEDVVAGDEDAAGYSPAASAAAMEELEKSELEREDMAGKLDAMEQQVETLQRIVSLKDDQIAALQSALAEAGGTAPEDLAEGAGQTDSAPLDDIAAMGGMADIEGQEASEGAGGDLLEGEDPDTVAGAMDSEAAAALDEEQTALEVEPEPEPEAKPAPAPAPAPKPAPAESGMMSYLLYGLGALVLAIVGFVLLRRRGEAEEPSISVPAKDVYADVELKEQEVEVLQEELEPEAETKTETKTETLAETLAEPPAIEEPPSRDNRGYGERKHDEYASDVEAGDALAEADIYIAYGRYPQAIDLLKNAIGNEPANPDYRLKLLEMHMQMDDRASAENELRELEAINDPASLERARQIMDGSMTMSDPLDTLSTPDLPPGDLAEDSGASLEADFAGLEIEEPGAAGSVADDLDLSEDFSETLTDSGDDEDLVIAADANGMSTKLDLARAYLDMGDEDGARQILEEVMLEGSEEQKAEAGSLLERLG